MQEQEIERCVVEAMDFIRNRFFGKYSGTVSDVDDDENRGRIKAQVPEVYEENVDSPWALPSVPFAGNNHGLVVLPEVGDGVWIEFEAGDPSRPIWTGCWWARNELPEPGGKETRVLVTSGGHKIVLDDENSELKLIHSGGGEIKMTDDDITIKIGTTQIVLSDRGVNINNGALEVKK
jgi:uncharacterized protein involved in type VI secretion and phage assembly